MSQVAKKAALLKPGSKGPAVALLQGALIDLGYKLPRSTKKKGVPDGIFAGETIAAVLAFQTANKLKADGLAGAQTIAVLDALMVAAAAPSLHAPPVVVPSPSTAEYKLGTDDPTIIPDPGAGIWNSSPTQATYVALGAAIVDILPFAYATVGDDATKHMAHYLGNSGNDYTIDLEGMVAEVPAAHRRYETEVAQAKQFVEMLAPGRYNIASQRVNGSYNRQSENANWYFAVGGYVTWGKGVAVVKDDPAGRQYDVDFEYKFFDRYNWDAGKSVTIGGITVTDAFMGEFHREGIAQEFNCNGIFKRHFTWRKGDAIPSSQLEGPGGR
jgi:Putative peptidoglycan binding domain